MCDGISCHCFPRRAGQTAGEGVARYKATVAAGRLGGIGQTGVGVAINLGLGVCGDRDRSRCNRHRCIGNYQRRQLVVSGQAAAGIRRIAQRNGVDVLAPRGHMGIIGRGAGVGQRFAAHTRAYAHVPRQTGAAVIRFAG